MLSSCEMLRIYVHKGRCNAKSGRFTVGDGFPVPKCCVFAGTIKISETFLLPLWKYCDFANGLNENGRIPAIENAARKKPGGANMCSYSAEIMK